MTKRVSGFTLCVVFGLAGNYFGYPIFFSSDYLFGSIFSIFALQAFGLMPGVTVACVISSIACLSTGTPYTVLILAAEVLAGGWLFSRKGVALVFADTFYWLALGMPFCYLASRFGLGVNQDGAVAVMFKSAINGVGNALIARLAFMTVHLSDREHLFPLREVMFSLLAFFLLIPSLAFLVYESRNDFNQFDSAIRQSLLGVSRHITSYLSLWIDEKLIRIGQLAWRKAHRVEVTQDTLDLLRVMDHDLAMVGVIDKNSISTIFSPLVDELGYSSAGQDFSDRSYINELKTTLQPQLTGIIPSKIGKPQPVVVLACPIVSGGTYDGYASGIFNLRRVSRLLSLLGQDRGVRVTLTDRKNLLIATSSPGVAIMSPFVRPQGSIRELAGGVSQWIPGQSASASGYERWRQAVYIVETTVGRHGEWKVIVEEPVASFLDELTAMYASQLEAVFLVLLVTMAFAEFLNRKLVASFHRFHDISHQLQQDPSVVDHVVWPVSTVKEVDFLIATVKEMATRLIATIREVREANLFLELRVAERTRQLEELNKTLEKRVDVEVDRRRKHEQLLLQQGKLAAMGEMLGAIAHQWRQPLNSLALCVQNIKDSYRMGELDQAYLDTTVSESMAQIGQMSKTIDDFRNFFRPDRAPVTFDAMAAVGEVLGLFGTQLRAHDIRVLLTCLTHRRTFDEIKDIVPCREKEIIGYKNEFEHVILNLITNAKDAIGEGKAKGLIAEQGLIAFEFSLAGDMIVITVSDNGGGVPEHVRERVFEPYFSTKEPGAGTGIGLYLSKIIIEEHMGGTLTLQQSGRGATFVITVPAAKSAAVNVMEGRPM